MNRLCQCEATLVAIKNPSLVTLGQILKLLDSMHLDPYPVHNTQDVFEPIQDYGVLLVHLFLFFDFLATQKPLFLLFFFAALDKLLNIA